MGRKARQVDPRFGQLLQFYLKRVGLTQVKLAEVLHIDPVVLNYYVRGRRYPRASMASQIVNALGLNEEEADKLLRHLPGGAPPELHTAIDKLEEIHRNERISREHKAKLAASVHNALHTWREIQRKRVRWIVIPVAGWQATYLAHPATARLVRRAIAEAEGCGINRSVVVVSPSQAGPLSEELAGDAKWAGRMRAGKIRLAVQQEHLGLGDAISAARKCLPDNEPFALILPDEGVEDSCLASMVAAYDKHKYCVIALRQLEESDAESYGVASLGEETDENLWTLKTLTEKPDVQPQDPALAVVGRYVLTPDIFKVLQLEATDPDPRTGHIELTDALDKLAQKERVLGYIYAGKVHTIRVSQRQLKQQLETFLSLAIMGNGQQDG